MATPTPDQKPLWLTLISYYDHSERWSLFVSREGEPGWEYQVKEQGGRMAYEPPTEAMRLPSILDTPYNPRSMLVMNRLTDEQADVVREVAGREPPPASNADGYASQHWVANVVEELVKRGIVALHLFNGHIKPMVGHSLRDQLFPDQRA
ncbi:hypothetical protein BDW62DRAFT_205060 [Aspergillus aurantiobrunneus]